MSNNNFFNLAQNKLKVNTSLILTARLEQQHFIKILQSKNKANLLDMHEITTQHKKYNIGVLIFKDLQN